MHSTPPYTAVGNGASGSSAIQRVRRGMSDGQKRRCRLAQSTAPLTRVTAWSLWSPAKRPWRPGGRRLASSLPPPTWARPHTRVGKSA